MQFRNYNLIRSELISIIAYLLMLALYFVISFIPDNRLWGVNWWGYFPIWVPLVLLGTGLCLPLILYSLFHVNEETKVDDKTDNSKGYHYFTSAIIFIVALSFYFFRVKTHFLGDGYGLLTMLGTNMAAYHQLREFGESLLHLWVYNIINIPGEYGALISYRIISISAGITFLFTLILAARKIYSEFIYQILFVISLISGGYLLLFFGYVENYSLLVYGVALFTLTGLLIIKNQINKLYIIPIFFLSIFFHVIGIVLFPAVVYLLLQNSAVGNRFSKLKPTSLFLIFLGVGLMASIIFYYLYNNYYFFRFAFVPLIENRFTIEGYTLFSINHLIDYANLIVLLFPGIVIFAAWLIISKSVKLLRKRDNFFLIILSLSAMGAAFILDPKLGMPRDWDLFAFAGIPLVVFAFNLIINSNSTNPSKLVAILLIIVLNFLCLIPRIASQALPKISLAHFENYIKLDKSKNRGVSGFLYSYYLSIGETEVAEKLGSLWNQKYPELLMMDKAKSLKDQKRYSDALKLYNNILLIDPVHFDIYNNLADCYISIGKYDSAKAYLDIALGMSPYNKAVWCNIGWVYYYQKKYAKAEQAWLKSIEYDSSVVQPLVGLVSLYHDTKNEIKYVEFLTRTVQREDAPGEIHVAYGDLLAKQGKKNEALREYDIALSKGLNPMFIEQRKQRVLKLQ